MKYLIYTLAILFLGISTSWAFPDFTFPDFRLSKWGDTKEQVLAVEPETLTALEDDPDILFGIAPLLSVDVFLTYAFEGEKLVAADYLLRDYEMSAEDYQAHFSELRKLLSSKYNTGPNTGRFYTGIAASVATWTTPATTIWLIYDSGQPFPLSIGYTSTEFNYLINSNFEMEEY